jgi:hypothetical protein
MNAQKLADELEKAPNLWFKDKIAGEWIIATLNQQQSELNTLKERNLFLEFFYKTVKVQDK